VARRNENRLPQSLLSAEYLAAVKQGPTKVAWTTTRRQPRLHYPGDYNILVPGHRDSDYREGVLKKHGVDKQVITFTTPGTHFEEPATAVEMAKHINDAFRRRVPRQRQHFLSARDAAV
jgi:aminocarboxymuconate-semialdehyde decarboxylase